MNLIVHFLGVNDMICLIVTELSNNAIAHLLVLRNTCVEVLNVKPFLNVIKS